MNQQSVGQQLRDALVGQAGGFLANPVRTPLTTCEVCATPVDGGYRVCIPCSRASGAVEVADLVGSSTYARPDHQTAFVMHGYKSSAPQVQHQRIVQLLIADALVSHRGCAERLVGSQIDGWTSVPSLTRKRPNHPLRAMVRPWLPGSMEIAVTASLNPQSPRSVTPGNFVVGSEVQDLHVLVVDDTWTTGSQVQSVAAALKEGGASKVTAYTVARWLEPSWPPTKKFLDARKQQSPKPAFDPQVCPFTHAGCP